MLLMMRHTNFEHSKSKPGKHGSAKARLELVSLFSAKKISHVGTVTDNIQVPMIEKTAMATYIDGDEVHAMNMRDHSMMILPMEAEMTIEAGKEIMWMEASVDTKSIETTDFHQFVKTT